MTLAPRWHILILMAAPHRIEQLTTRQRECLRLHHQRYRVKEIARALGISENTASGYLTEATALLGVGGRAAAAAALAAFEAAHPDARGRFSAGDAPPPLPPSPEPPADPAPAVDTAPPSRSGTIWWPLRSGSGNDLTVAQRFLWVFLLAFLLVAGFGLFAFFVRTLSDIVAVFRR